MSETALPYPGLRAFSRDESHLFFGREACVDSIIDRLAQTRFLAVLGASGSGKSSLVRTGLLNGLELGFYARAGARWTVVDIHPGGQPIRNLAAGLAAVSLANPLPVDIEVMRALIARGPRSIVDWCTNGGLKEKDNLLILVDQFEELFRYGSYADREEAEAFVALLLESARAAEMPIYVVLTMRSEYLGACSLIQGLAEQINAGFYLTPRMSRDECSQAIKGPAAVTGFAIQPALVNQLLNDMAGFAPWDEQGGIQQSQVLSRRADQLPLMQHLLNRLWLRAAARTDGVTIALTLDDYRAAGGLTGALDAHGAEVVASLSVEDQAEMERIFRALISGPDPTNAVRRPCRFSDLAAETVGGAATARRIVDAFRAPQCNFLQPGFDVVLTDDTVIDLSHESLIRQWGRLADWLRLEARADANWRRLLMGAERKDAGEGGMLIGRDLDSLVSWWDAEQPTMLSALRHGVAYDVVKTYLSESREAASADKKAEKAKAVRQKRLLISGIAVLSGLLVVSVTLGVIANSVTQNASDDAKSNAKLLDDLLKIVSSEKNTNLLGSAQMQKDFYGSLLPHLQDIERKYSGIGGTTVIALRTQQLAANTLDVKGEAANAVKLRGDAFRIGFQQLKEVKPQSQEYDELARIVLSIGYLYGWSLLDAGLDADGEDVIKKMNLISQQYYYPNANPRLILPLAQYESLASRYFSDSGKTSFQAAHVKNWRLLIERSDAPPEDLLKVEVMRSLRPPETEETGNARNLSQARSCEIIGRLYSSYPQGRDIIVRKASCLVTKALSAQEKHDEVEADKLMQEAQTILDNALLFEKDSGSLLIAESSLLVERAKLADIRKNGVNEAKLQDDAQGGAVAELKIKAARVFVQAFKDRSVFQANTSEARQLYQDFSNVEFSKISNYDTITAQIKFFLAIKTAVKMNRERFSKSPSYAYVDGDASRKAAELLLKNKQPAEAEKMLSSAIQAFKDGKTIERATGFSELTASACTAWSKMVELLAEGKRVDAAKLAFADMTQRCEPALKKYPWDFYLRAPLHTAEIRLGKLLYEEKRFAEARPLLQNMSNWGSKESSKLLADMYREGKSVPVDIAKADNLDALAARQSMKRFTVPTNFAGVTYPFHVYIQEFAPGTGFQGIDDQVTWVKEARGGDVKSDVVAAFRKLNQIAKDKNVSFPDLAVYALGLAQKAKESEGETKK